MAVSPFLGHIEVLVMDPFLAALWGFAGSITGAAWLYAVLWAS